MKNMRLNKSRVKKTPIKKPIETISKYMKFDYFEDMIEQNHLALVNPEFWDDRNDSNAILHFKKITKINHVFSACFTSKATETSHHWAVYSKYDGVRVIFDKNELISNMITDSRYICDKIEYIALKNFDSKVQAISRIPFIKRKAYEDEREYRIIWTAKRYSKDIKYISLPKNAMLKIVFGPLVNDNDRLRMTNLIKEKNTKIEFGKSTILESRGWLGRIYNITT